MKLNKKLEIGISAVLVLKKHGGLMKITDLIKEVDTTEDFLKQIMMELRSGGVVTVKRGPGGGYSINENTELTAYSIAKAVGRFPDNLKVGDTSLTAQLHNNIIEAFRNTKL